MTPLSCGSEAQKQSRAKAAAAAAAILDLEVSAGHASPSSRGLWLVELCWKPKPCRLLRAFLSQQEPENATWVDEPCCKYQWARGAVGGYLWSGPSGFALRRVANTTPAVVHAAQRAEGHASARPTGSLRVVRRALFELLQDALGAGLGCGGRAGMRAVATTRWELRGSA